MKDINILSLIQAHNSLEKEHFNNFLSYNDIEIKDKEIDDLKVLIRFLYDSSENKYIFNQFFVGYKIPQIGKEFDLLRFGESYIINIELKNESTEEKIFKQLKRNKYYLNSLNKKIFNFSYVAQNNKLFILTDKETLEEIHISVLIDLLIKQNLKDFNDINLLFNPSDYLVSPFNSTDKFLENKYFLTHQQEEIKEKIITSIQDTSKANFIAIKGSAGTGKTLLTYDIAKELKTNDQKVLILHCGQINSGQNILQNKSKWNIVSIKYYNLHKFSDYNLIIIDEAQRIYPNQLDDIVEKIQIINGNCILSYDKIQTLATWEENRNIDEKINAIPSLLTYKLSEKIRTNKEIASFIKMLFNKKHYVKLLNKDNIKVNYFNHIRDTKDFLSLLNQRGCKVLRFTPSQYSSEHHKNYSSILYNNSHEIIGQEFDEVAVVIDQYFTYNENDKLIYNSKSYYHPVKMLFQNITRTRKKLNVIIINNSEMLERCITILE